MPKKHRFMQVILFARDMYDDFIFFIVYVYHINVRAGIGKRKTAQLNNTSRSTAYATGHHRCWPMHR
jgi:hypothetical protein